MSKVVKEMLMGEIRDRLGESRDLLVVDSSRVDAISTNRMRLALQEKDITTFAVKNSLAKKVLGDVGVSGLESVLQGPSTLIWGGEDIVALSKEIAKWAKDFEGLEIKGGSTEGTPLSAVDVEKLSKSPGREELISKIVGLALSPGARLASLLLGPGGKIAGQLKTLADKDE